MTPSAKRTSSTKRASSAKRTSSGQLKQTTLPFITKRTGPAPSAANKGLKKGARNVSSQPRVSTLKVKGKKEEKETEVEEALVPVKREKLNMDDEKWNKQFVLAREKMGNNLQPSVYSFVFI